MTIQILDIEDQVEGPMSPRVVNPVSPIKLRTRVSEIVEEIGEPP